MYSINEYVFEFSGFFFYISRALLTCDLCICIWVSISPLNLIFVYFYPFSFSITRQSFPQLIHGGAATLGASGICDTDSFCISGPASKRGTALIYLHEIRQQQEDRLRCWFLSRHPDARRHPPANTWADKRAPCMITMRPDMHDFLLSDGVFSLIWPFLFAAHLHQGGQRGEGAAARKTQTEQRSEISSSWFPQMLNVKLCRVFWFSD